MYAACQLVTQMRLRRCITLLTGITIDRVVIVANAGFDLMKHVQIGDIVLLGHDIVTSMK